MLTVLAQISARRHRRAIRARTEEEAIGALAWMMRRRWALTALRENARLKLERLEFVGRGAAAAVDRRQCAAAGATARARRAACAFARGPHAAYRQWG